jgi:hypothetical protein
MLGGSGAIVGGLQSDYAELDEAALDRDPVTYQQRAEAANVRGRLRTAQVLFFGGLGLTAVGATLLIVEMLGSDGPEPDAERVTLIPTVGRASAGIGLHLNF